MPDPKGQNQSPQYEIQVSGQIDTDRAGWFGEMDMTVKLSEQGAIHTVLSGDVPDQAALFGILTRIRNLGLKLVSVKQIDRKPDLD